MTKKKYIGRCISLMFKDREPILTGLVVDYNDDWTLLKHNAVPVFFFLKCPVV